MPAIKTGTLALLKKSLAMLETNGGTISTGKLLIDLILSEDGQKVRAFGKW